MGTKGAVLACLLVTLAISGCGKGERGADAAAVRQRFHAALEAGDGQAACDELSEETASKLEQEEKKPCDEAILVLDLAKGGTVGATDVYERSAFAFLSEGSADFLDEGPEGWTVSATGCKPTPSDQPYECELEP